MRSVSMLALALGLLVTPVVVPTPAAADGSAETWIVTRSAASGGAGGTVDSTVAALEALGARVVPLPQIGVLVAEVTGADPSFAAAASALPGVQAVGRDVAFTLESAGAPDGASGDASDPAGWVEPPLVDADDPLSLLQWGHQAIDLGAAWDRLAAEGKSRGAGVRVAILDTGIDADHPDLAPNLDVARSRSFIPGEPWQARDGFIFHHGTSVAGIVAAADNGLGIVGVAPEAELVAVKVVSEITNGGSAAALLQGIVYAADIEADVINMSLDAGLALRDGDAALWSAFVRAAGYAHRRGATMIAAAGNDARDLDRDRDARLVPQQLPHVITVTSTAPAGWALAVASGTTTDLDLSSSYNNYGRTVVDLAAPGGGFHDLGDDTFARCTVALPDGGEMTSWCISFDFVFTTIGDGWLWANGTSFAAPHVAGVAALVIAQAGGDLHPSQVASALRRGAVDLGPRGKDPRFGHGRLDAARSLR